MRTHFTENQGNQNSCGLFDYQNSKKEQKYQEFEVSQTGVVALTKNEPIYIPSEVMKKEVINLLNLNFQDKSVTMSHTKKQYLNLECFDETRVKNRSDFHERFIWQAIRSESGGALLQMGDIYRLGRMRFRVREIHDSKGFRTIGTKGVDNHVHHQEHEGTEEAYCRVCMEPETADNEFANVCDCSKRMPIHANCLMDWVKTKMNKRTNEAYEFYTWLGLDCDICRKPYPGKFVLTRIFCRKQEKVFSFML